MASDELNKMKTILGGLDSQATKNPQPSKTLNSGTAKIDGANPSSPSTNNATRRAQYDAYIKTLDKDNLSSLYDTVKGYKAQGMNENQIYDAVLGKSNTVNNPNTITQTTTPDTSKGLDLTIKGNFDVYNPIDWKNQPETLQQYYIQANNDMKSSRRALSQYMLQQDALESKSSNINQVTTLIDAIENAYDKGVFDTKTIANTLGVSEDVVSLIQQGKANELVKLDQEYVQDQLKSYYRAEEDYDINLQRTMEDYNLAKTRLDDQYNSAMQTLRRNLFDEKRAASVGSAVAGISGSEYAINVIEAKHQQNMDDLEANYLYSSMNQKYSYTRAIQDYNKNIQRLSEDFDDSLKAIQAGVLQQFQEIDNKIGLTTAQLAKAYGTLQQNVITAKASAATSYLEALSKNEGQFADALAKIYGIDKNELFPTETEGGISYTPVSQGKLVGGMNTYIESIADKIAKHGVIRQGRCGEPVNDYLKALGVGVSYDNYKSTKLNSKNSDTPTIGSIAIWDKTGTADGNKYGHVAIVTGIDEKNGKITVLESNKGTGLRYHTYNMNNVYGYFDPSKSAEISTGKEVSSKERDYSGLTPEQVAAVDQLATELLGATQSKVDKVTHNAIAQMMREGKTVDQIKDMYRDSLKGNIMSDSKYKNIKYAADKLITKKGLTSKDTRDEFYDQVQDLVRDGDYDMLLNSLQSSMYDAMSTDNKNALDSALTLEDYLNEMEKALKNIYNGGKSTGADVDLLESAANRIGETTDPELAEFKNYVNAVVQIYRKKITGAAFTESERKEYQKEFPSLFKSQSYNTSVINSLRNKDKTDINRSYGSVLGSTQAYIDLVNEINTLKSTPAAKSQSAMSLSTLKNILKSKNLIFSGSSTTNGGSSAFDIPGGMNTGSTNGTGTFTFPRTNMVQ